MYPTVENTGRYHCFDRDSKSSMGWMPRIGAEKKEDILNRSLDIDLHVDALLESD